MTVDNHNIRASLRAWMNQHQWDIAATLTFADAYSAKQAHQAVMKFWNETDYQLYGNASRRRNLKCERVMFLEGDGEIQHHHYHAAIKCPEKHAADLHKFCRLLTRRWLKLHPRCQRVEFKPATDSSGWIQYCTKQLSRTDCDRMDVYSSHIAATQQFCRLLTRRWLKLHPRCQRVEFKPATDSSGWIYGQTPLSDPVVMLV